MYNRDSKLMRKLLGKAAPDHSTDTSPAGPGTGTGTGTGSLGITSAPSPSSTVPPPPSFRPAVSQNAVYPAGVPIQCLDASPDKRAAVLAGRHILKTVKLDGGNSIHDWIDIRAIISAQPAGGGTKLSSLADQLSIKDVKWHGESTIFTACSNGKIFAYDLAHMGGGVGGALEFVQTREDERQVNTLDVNPHRGSYLLSGSQDGIVRCFDIRMPQPSRTGGLTFRAVQSFKCNADGVRHVKWSPTDGLTFACGTEAGAILKWDIRKAMSPVLRLNAHENACSSISWHPDGDHLMSAGWDAKCHVWDVTKFADKRQKAKWSISTPAPVSAIAWRPGLWSATAQGRRAAQVAVSYDDSSQKRHGISMVHVWDLARPTMAFKEIDRFDTPPSGLLWKDQDVLWTAGRDGFFNQCDVAAAPRVIDRQSLSSMAFSPRGDVMMFLDERPHHRPRRAPPPPPPPPPKPEAIRRTSTFGSSSPSTPVLSISRSDSEEDVMGSFIGHHRRGYRRRRGSTRLSMPQNNMPTTAATAEEIIPLDQTMKATGIFKSQQAMAFGRVPAATKVNVYHYLSTNYLEILERELPPNGRPLVERVSIIMEQYARAAEVASLFRLAQTWRILAYAVNLLLNRRGQYHMEKRLGLTAEPAKEKRRPGRVEENGEETPRKPSHELRSAPVRSLLSEEIESTSNVPTPLARPVEDEFVPGKRLTPVLESESFTLGPAVHSAFLSSPRRRLDSAPISVMSHESGNTQVSSMDGYDFYDAETFAKAIDMPAADGPPPPPPPLPAEYSPRTPSRRPAMRQDSSELMFSVSDSTKNSGTASATATARRVSTVSEQDEEVYHSRIRGKELDDSPVRPKRPALPDSPEELFLISQTTIGTETTRSQGSEPSSQTQAAHTDAPASAAIMTPTPKPKPAPSQQPAKDEPQTITEEDYLPWPSDPPYPHPLSATSSDNNNTTTTTTNKQPLPPPPLNPYGVISRAVQFETRTSALHASAMILLLKPLVPDDVVDPLHAVAILRTHHVRLMGMRHFVEAAHLRNLCTGKGNSFDWGVAYPSIFAPAQLNTKVAFLCPSCRKVHERDSEGYSPWRCDRCGHSMGACAVCGHRDASPLEEEDVRSDDDEEKEAYMSMWWYCPSCAHGGHATCLEAWHAETEDDEEDGSEGCCPLDGCGHACLPGRYRSESGAARSDELGRAVVGGNDDSVVAAGGGGAGAGAANTGGNGTGGGGTGGKRSSVRSDNNDVPQSKAVESVRESLGRSSPGSILSSSPGREGGRDRERRKSVKFAGR